MILSEYLGHPRKTSWQQRLFGHYYSCPVEHVSYPPNMGPEALGPLKDLRALRTLSLTGSRIDDEDIRAILEFRGLVHLDLSATEVTDEGFRSLAMLPELQELHLDHTRISDRSLDALASGRFLELSIRDTDVTEGSSGIDQEDMPRSVWLSVRARPFRFASRGGEASDSVGCGSPHRVR